MVKCRYCNKEFSRDKIRFHEIDCREEYLQTKEWIVAEDYITRPGSPNSIKFSLESYGKQKPWCVNCEEEISEENYFEFSLPQGIFANYNSTTREYSHGDTHEMCCSQECVDAMNHFFNYLIKTKQIAYDDTAEMWYYIKKRETIRIYKHELVKLQKILQDVLSGNIDEKMIEKRLKIINRYVETEKK